MDYLVVGLGGFLGANARYLMANWIGGRYGTSFPYGTLVINVSGSFVIGLFLVLITDRYIVHPNWRLFFSRAAKSAGESSSQASRDTRRDHDESADAGSAAGGGSLGPAAVLARH